jgi:hypothetical protein
MLSVGFDCSPAWPTIGRPKPGCRWPTANERASVGSSQFGQQPARLASPRTRTRTTGENCRYSMEDCNNKRTRNLRNSLEPPRQSRREEGCWSERGRPCGRLDSRKRRRDGTWRRYWITWSASPFSSDPCCRRHRRRPRCGAAKRVSGRRRCPSLGRRESRAIAQPGRGPGSCCGRVRKW